MIGSCSEELEQCGKCRLPIAGVRRLSFPHHLALAVAVGGDALGALHAFVYMVGIFA